MTALGRRDVLKRLVYGVAAMPVLQACGGSTSSSIDASGPDSSITGDWASGGTVAMTDKASYPDPFTVAPTSCALVATTTAGPCTTATDLVREDISEGWTGLPVRLALKVVDASCNPLANAKVKIWHTNNVGSYSGQTPSNAFCLLDQSYSSSDFMRGVGTTDGSGVVYFDTCYPGWYSGRAIHIHFQVESNGNATRVSQLFFPEAVTEGIFASHVDYREFGQPNTTFSNDSIVAAIPSAKRADHIFEVARMTDGAMLASKVVTVV